MTAPERIWADFTLLHNQVTTFYCQDGPYSGGTEYVRAALEPQPDPRDEVIARLAEALEFYALRDNWEVDEQGFSFADRDEGTIARAALAAAKVVQHG